MVISVAECIRGRRNENLIVMSAAQKSFITTQSLVQLSAENPRRKKRMHSGDYSLLQDLIEFEAPILLRKLPMYMPLEIYYTGCWPNEE